VVIPNGSATTCARSAHRSHASTSSKASNGLRR
jgi:hypothetical protein